MIARIAALPFYDYASDASSGCPVSVCAKSSLRRSLRWPVSWAAHSSEAQCFSQL